MNINGMNSQTSISGLMSQYFKSANASSAKSIQRIASGLRINSAADDASGLAVAQKLYSQTTGIDVASQNAQDAISMTRVADGALGGVSNIMNRMTELATRAANGTLGDTERGILQQEFDQLRQEIDRTGRSSQFNGNPLFDGSTYTMQVGADSDNTMDIEMGELSSAALGLDQVDLTSAKGAGQALKAIQDAGAQVSKQRGSLGAAENGLQAAVNNLGNSKINLTESLSRIMGADIAKESINLSMSNTLGQVSAAMMKNSNYLIHYNAMQLLLH